MKHFCRSLVAGAVAIAHGFGTGAVAEDDVPYQVVDETNIPTALTAEPGDPERGRAVVVHSQQGNCLACHAIPTLADEPYHGTVAPSLAGVATRYSVGELRLRLVDPKQINPDTPMPAYYQQDGLYRVAKDFEGTTILTAQQVEDVLAFLLTLDDQAPADGPVLPNALSALERVAIAAPQGSPYPWLFSGYHVVNEQIQAIQDDDDINPAFLTVEDGARLWSTAEGAAGRSCADCHGPVASMEGVGIRYPVFHEPSGKLINLEQRINLCRTEQMQAEPWEWGSRELVAMTTLVRHQSRGQPMSVAVDGPARPLFERGKEIYYQRRGLFDMSCAHCHETNYGQRLRGNLLSQGHINAHPIYLSGASAMEFLHELFAFCNRRVRAEPYEYGSEEFVDLELYMAWRGQGLPLETPGVR